MGLRPHSARPRPGVLRRAVQVLLSDEDLVFALEDSKGKPLSEYFREMVRERRRKKEEKENK